MGVFEKLREELDKIELMSRSDDEGGVVVFTIDELRQLLDSLEVRWLDGD